MIASGSLDLTIRIWNPSTGVCTWNLNILDLFGYTVPDRLRFADGDSTLELEGRDGSKRVWTLMSDPSNSSPRSAIRVMDFPASDPLSEQVRTGPRVPRFTGNLLTLTVGVSSVRVPIRFFPSHGGFSGKRVLPQTQCGLG